MAVDTPHFALPFLLTKDGAAVNEQDTVDDIATCVVAIMSTHIGWREEAPDFGIPDLTFRQMPIGAADIYDMIGTQEQRALMVVEERPGDSGALTDKISVGVSLHAKGDL